METLPAPNFWIKKISKVLFRVLFVSAVGFIFIQSDDINSQIMFFNTQLQTGESIKQIAAGSNRTCALFANGRVKCWGEGGGGYLGQVTGSTYGDNESPISLGYVNVGGFVKQLAMGDYHVCALLAGGTVRCWGNATDGSLGYGNTTTIGDNETPAAAGDVPVGALVTQISVSPRRTCALLSDGNVRCWGNNSAGRLGYGNTTNVGSGAGPSVSAAGDVSVGGKVKQIVTGSDATCALLVTGDVKCWGEGSNGSHGLGGSGDVGDNELPSSQPNLNFGTDKVKKLASQNSQHFCALLVSGQVKCWGANADGQLGQGDTTTRGNTAGTTPNNIAALNLGGTAVDIFAGPGRACALLGDGSVKCWGRNANGQLGYGDVASKGDNEALSSYGFVPVSGLDGKVVQMSLGEDHTCALYSTGKARCWGANANGQLGYADTVQRGDAAATTPDQLGYVGTGGEVAVTQVATGRSTTCVLLSTGDARCWGLNSAGQLGYGHTTSSGGAGEKLPSQMGKVYVGGKIRQISASNVHTCALLENGRIRCWGAYTASAPRMGNGATQAIGDNDTPMKANYVTITEEATQIDTGLDFGCAVLKDGGVRCWGDGQTGRLGNGSLSDIADPGAASNLNLGEEATQITLGEEFGCALLKSGDVRCWGSNDSGQLGLGNNVAPLDAVGDGELPSSQSVVNLGGSKAVKIAAGYRHVCAILETGNVMCWGNGTGGKLGYGNTNSIGDDESPASAGTVSLGAKAIDIATGEFNSCALLETGRVLCWGGATRGGTGNPGYSHIGDGEAPSTVPPIQTGMNVVSIYGKRQHFCAILENGRLLCWGYNDNGQLGLGNNDTIGDDEVPVAGGQVKLFPQPDEAAPPDPLNLVATPISGPAVTLTWTSGGGSTCDYRIAYQTTSAPGDCSTGTTIASSLVYGTSHTITGLTGATLYGFRVCAENCDFPTPEVSSGITATATTLQAPPPNPTSPVANPISANQIDLSWTSGAGTTADYRISYLVGLTAPATCSTGNTIGESSISGTSYSVTGLVQNTTYTFRICAINGNAPPDESSGVTIVSTTLNPTVIYRSVGPGNRNILAQGSVQGNLTVDNATSTATFASALPDDIGVGDAIVYDCTAGGGWTAADCVAFIHGRTSSTVYTVKTNAGAAPTAYAANTVWRIYRAYTSLNAAEAGSENPEIALLNATLGDFDTGTFANIAGASRQWNIALYADGVDTTQTEIFGWTTSPAYYLKIYTPYLSSEVGVSQRHAGTYSTSAYRIELAPAAGHAALEIDEEFVVVEGVQIRISGTAASSSGIYIGYPNSVGTPATVSVSNNIIMSTATTGGSHFGIWIDDIGNGGNAKIWNNLIYNFNGGATDGGFHTDVANYNLYFYNNTIVNSNNGMELANLTAATAYVKNNIVQGATTAYACGGKCHASSDYNISNTATATGGANDRVSQAVLFYDSGAHDYRPSAFDSAAKDVGTNLSTDPAISFTYDLAGATRTGSWDIGALEGPTGSPGNIIFRSAGTGTSALSTGGAANLLTVATGTSLATFSANQPSNFGVGDAIVYDCTAGGGYTAADCIVFVTARINSQNYIVKKADGLAPSTGYSSGQTWASYRAYNSLFTAIEGNSSVNGNASIPAALRNFDTWTGGKSLSGAGEVWNIALYADGVDTISADSDIDGWTTSAQNYLRIFVPSLSSEVGLSQRHSGVWDSAKYILNIQNDGSGIEINEEFVRFDGLQINFAPTGGGATSPILIDGISATSGIYISNNIVRGANANADAGFWGSPDSAAKMYVFNNIFYDFSRGLVLEYGTGYFYNNTIYNVSTGVKAYCTSTSVYAKNTLVQGVTASGTGFDGCALFDASSGYNISSDGTSTGAATDRTNITDVLFYDVANKDFRLSMLDTQAKDRGTDLSADANLAFNTDIIGKPRIDWDIGASEGYVIPIFRSVAAGATAALATSSSPLTGNTMTVAGITATFSKPLPDNVGVGDAIQYDCNNSGGAIAAGDCIVFISGRTSAKVYTVLTATGGVPTPDSADTSWGIYRAYISLANWETGTENTGIDSDVRTFDSGNGNLVSNNEKWSVAVYGNNGTADTTAFTISGWTTGRNNPIRIYSPYLPSEVGVSQRHKGIWDGNLATFVSTADDIIEINNTSFVTIEGLQFQHATSSVGGTSMIWLNALTGDISLSISHNIFRGIYSAGTMHRGIAKSASTDTGDIRIYNNIISTSSSTSGEAIHTTSATGRVLAYNNTVYGYTSGLWFSSATTVTAKNNIVQGSSGAAYTGTLFVDGANNISDDGSTPGGTGNRTNSTVSFADVGGGNFRPSSTDTEARNNGVNVSGDSLLPITTDAKGSIRPATFDIGALNADPFMMYRSLGSAATGALASGGGTNLLSISGTTATFATAPGNAIGVGDVIQYDFNTGGTIGAGDRVAIITKRLSANQYTVYTAANAAPSVYSGSVWDICRAYDRLSRVPTLTENTCINASLSNFDSGATDLTAKKAIFNIAVYGSASADTNSVAWTPTTGSGWTVSSDYHLRIYSPYRTTEVGTTQRHAGLWDTNKYYMDVGGNGIAFTDIDYVKVDGLQVLLTSPGASSSAIKCEGCADVEISNNILRRTGGSNSVLLIWINDGDPIAKIWNNIIYDFTGAGSAGIMLFASRGNVYNNTLYTGVTGIYAWMSKVTAKNNIVQGTTSDSFVEYDQSYYAASSGWNVSDDTTTPGGTSETTSGTVSFANTGSRDLRLANGDTVAKGTGTSLGSDSVVPFTTDAAGASRNAIWDRGALKPAVTQIYRSVGPGNISPLAVSDGTNSLTIAGTTATFTSPIPDNVGVGDVIKWGANFVFISGRTSSTVYTVQNTTGGAPTTVAGNTAWSIYRAYTSLANWESGTENTGHGLTFDAGDRNIATNGEQWNVACYGDGIDATLVDIDGWTTSPSAYIKIYAPYLTSDVGTRQRHIGKWDPKYYTLQGTGMMMRLAGIGYSDLSVRIEGLQTYSSALANFEPSISIERLNANSEVILSSNIIRGDSVTGAIILRDSNSFTSPDAKIFVFNNIIYGSTTDVLVGFDSGKVYFYNNTIAGTATNAIMTFFSASLTMTIKNNLVYSASSINYSAGITPQPGSGNNVSSDTTAPGQNVRTSQTPVFVDASMGDYRLSPSDTAAKNYGANLSDDIMISFTTDIAGNDRPIGTSWDAGASEANTTLFTDDTNGAGVEFNIGTHSNTEWNGSDSVALKASTVSQRELASGDATFDTTNLESIWHINGATMNETANNTLADSGPGGNTCTITTGNGATNKSIAGQLNEAFDFDAADYFTCGSAVSIDDMAAFTVSAWVRPDGSGSGAWGTIASKAASGFGSGWTLSWNGTGMGATNSLVFQVDYATTNLMVRTDTMMDTSGRWQHVVATWDGSTTAANVKIYLNGALVNHESDTNGAGARVTDAAQTLTIGGHSGGGGWDGRLDEVILYKRVLSAAEAAELYNRQAGQYGLGEPGLFTSRVMDSSSTSTSWSNMLVSPRGAYQRELPYQATESTYANNVDTSNFNLLGQWYFGESVLSNGSVTVESVNKKSGTLTTDNGATNKIVTGKFGNGIQFDGSDYVTISSGGTFNMSGTTLRSWAAWIKPNSQTAWNTIVAQEAGLSYYYIYFLGPGPCAGNSIGLYMSMGGNTLEVCTVRAPLLNQWNHIAITYDGANATQALRPTMYINGESVAFNIVTNSGTMGTADKITLGDVFIGSTPSWNEDFSGTIDELSIWGTVLTATDVANLYKRGTANIKFQVRSCDDGSCSGETFVGPDGTASTYFTELLNTGLTIPHYTLPTLLPNRYFQYRATFETTDSTVRPELDKVRVRGN